MNTGPEFQPQGPINSGPTDNLLETLSQIEPDQKDRQIQELQSDLATEKDRRREERFFFIFLCTMLFDLTIFANMSNWAIPVVIFLMQIILLAFIAKRLGMEEIHAIFSSMIARIADGIAKQ